MVAMKSKYIVIFDILHYFDFWISKFVMYIIEKPEHTEKIYLKWESSHWDGTKLTTCQSMFVTVCSATTWHNDPSTVRQT